VNFLVRILVGINAIDEATQGASPTLRLPAASDRYKGQGKKRRVSLSSIFVMTAGLLMECVDAVF
jgi:hypothetical protein